MEEETSETLSAQLGINEQPSDDADPFTWLTQGICGHRHYRIGAASMKRDMSNDFALLFDDPGHDRIWRSHERTETVGKVDRIPVSFVNPLRQANAAI
jgi:hypothetical protein